MMMLSVEIGEDLIYFWSEKQVFHSFWLERFWFSENLTFSSASETINANLLEWSI